MAAIPLAYNLRSLFVRRTETVLTLLAIALSVAVLAVVLAMARGFDESLTTTGRADNIVVLRKGATSEGVSAFGYETARTVVAFPQWHQDEQGRPVVEAELYAAFALGKVGGGIAYAPLRGIGEFGFALRPDVRITAGRAAKPGTLELMVGKNLLERLDGCRLGGSLELAGKDWPIVGVLDSSGSAFDSEIWGDVKVLVAAFDRQGFNLIIGRLSPKVAVGGFLADIRNDQRLNSEGHPEQQYFKDQAGVQGEIFQALAWFLALIMSVGAMFGAANTLHASVAARTREIGALLALGFQPRAVFLSFLFEALVLGLLGGVLGVVLAIPVNGMATGTMNWATFTEQTFKFHISGSVVAAGLILAAVVGLLGGALPALRASRLKPMHALKSL